MRLVRTRACRCALLARDVPRAGGAGGRRSASAADAARDAPIAWHGVRATGSSAARSRCRSTRRRPTGPTLDLAVVRTPARATRSDRIGSLVFNPGGPGRARRVVPHRRSRRSLPAALRDRFDLVGFDPRGVGHSSPIECEDSLDPLFDQSFQPDDRAARAGLVDGGDARRRRRARRGAATCSRTCRPPTPCTTSNGSASRWASDRLSFVGVLVRHVPRRQLRRRVPRPRARLRARRPGRPDRRRGTQVDARPGAWLRARARRLPRRLLERTRAARSTTTVTPPAAYDALRARAADAPAGRRRPDGRAPEPDPLRRRGAPAAVPGPAGVAGARRRARRGRPRRRVDAAARWPTRSSGATRDGRDDHALEAFWAVTCLDGPVVGDVDAAAALEHRAVAVAPRHRRVHREQQPPVLGVAGAARSPPPGRSTAAGAPPILVVGTTDDPATPLVQAQRAGAALDRGRLLVADGEQHTAFDDGQRVRRPRGDALPRRPRGSRRRGTRLLTLGSLLADHPDLLGRPAPRPARVEVGVGGASRASVRGARPGRRPRARGGGSSGSSRRTAAGSRPCPRRRRRRTAASRSTGGAGAGSTRSLLRSSR